MGCSSSRVAHSGGGGGGVVPPSAAPAAERRPHLRSRSLGGICRGGHDGSVHAYTALPLEDLKDAAAAEPEEEKPAAAAAAMANLDASVISSSWTARWSPKPAPSSPLPPALDLDPAAVLPGLRQLLVQVPSPSHPALLFPEHENPPPPPPPTEETTASDDDVDMGSPAVRDIPEVVTAFVHAPAVDEFHEQPEKKNADNEAAAPDVVSVDVVDDVSDGDDVPPPVVPAVPSRRRPPPVVLYVTSLRSVRRTFEDCRAARAILRCYGARVDERDVSMHAAFRSELRGLLLLAGGGFEAGPTLPRVFVVDGRDGGQRRDLGGADELRAMHEAGELAGVLQAAGCELQAVNDVAAAAATAATACAACGDARFLPCETCHGSCKVFVDDEGCGGRGRRRRVAGFFRQCPDCNENGLIRCPVCCY